jgi:UDP-N-acetylglucosamine:LPS N-acetylglucosamine transferase
MTKILAIASAGGHLTQLMLALHKVEAGMDVTYVTTKTTFLVEGRAALLIPDFSRENPWVAVKALLALTKILKEQKPQVAISSGAAPGLLALFVAHLNGVGTIWLDSCANYERLSLSGRIAIRFADLVLTQWAHLETNRVKHLGTVL